MIIEYDRKKPRLEIINMIDVMLFMLCFFMVFMTFKTERTGIDVKLPTAVTASKLAQDFTVIVITKDGSLFLNEKTVTFDTLSGDLKRERSGAKPVVIKPDQEVSYGSLVKVMDILRECKIYNTSLAVDRPPTVQEKN